MLSCAFCPQRLGYAARSAFKLQEIQKRFNVIPKGGSVLDLGCHPGAWLQVVCQSLGPSHAGGAGGGAITNPASLSNLTIHASR